jgi:glycosyltransferase involved in cell wall biosynthesis
MVSFDIGGGQRFTHFKKSFLAYANQIYENKELVIIVSGDNEHREKVHKYVKQSQRQDVNLVFSDLKPLGALRNLALDRASGDVVCQWDDDDVSHPNRISDQLRAMQHAGVHATVLRNYVHLFALRRSAVLCDWAKLRLPHEPGLPGTLLAEKAILPRYSDDLTLDEDSQLQRDLVHNGVIVMPVQTLLPLYVYIYHGTNVFPEQHHFRTARATACDRLEIESSANYLHQVFADCRLDTPLSIVDKEGNVIFHLGRSGLHLPLTAYL